MTTICQVPCLPLLHLPARAQAEAAAAGLVGGGDGGRVLDQHAAGGEVGAGHVRQQLGRGGVRVGDQGQGGGAHLAGVVRRDGGGHADRDAGGAVGQQVGEAAGQHDGLVLLAVVVGAEIHRVVVDAVQHGAGDRGHPRLGVAHGRRVIAVDVAEIALALDQRVAGGEILRQAHQRVVDRGLAVRVVLADHVADHAGAFLEPGGRVQPQLVHGVDQPAVHRLQPVAHVRQGARHDGGQRVGEIALAQRVGEGRVLDGSGKVVRHAAS